MEIWETVAVILGGFLLVTDVILRFASLKTRASQPQQQRQQRLQALEDRLAQAESQLDRGDKHFRRIDAYIEVTALALLALLDHGTRGNNVAQMEEAKKQLTEYILHQ